MMPGIVIGTALDFAVALFMIILVSATLVAAVCSQTASHEEIRGIYGYREEPDYRAWRDDFQKKR